MSPPRLRTSSRSAMMCSSTYFSVICTDSRSAVPTRLLNQDWMPNSNIAAEKTATTIAGVTATMLNRRTSRACSRDPASPCRRADQSRTARKAISPASGRMMTRSMTMSARLMPGSAPSGDSARLIAVSTLTAIAAIVSPTARRLDRATRLANAERRSIQRFLRRTGPTAASITCPPRPARNRGNAPSAGRARRRSRDPISSCAGYSG